MFTTEQRSWLTQFLGDNVAEPPDPSSTDKAAPNQPGQPGGDNRFGIAPAVIIPPIINLIKDLTGQLTGTVIIQNLTKTDLILDASSIPPDGRAVYDGKKPNPKIPAGGSDSFKLKTEKNLILISTEDVEATTRYFVGDQKTIWACHFHNPRIPLQENSADTTVTGEKSAQFSATAKPTSGNDATFTFVLTGGGDAPTPGGASAVPLSCRVSVVNQTQATLFLRKQDKATGDYVTNAATSLAPGAKTDFVFAATPGGTDKEIRGLMSWDVGDPKQASWDLMWDNPQGSKNYTAGLLDPKDGPFHSLDQIDQGDENVPVTFTLSGGGSGPPTPQGGGAKATVTITNNTKSALKLAGQNSDNGAFQNAPPPSIEAGKSAIIVQLADPKAPEKGCKGSLSWAPGDGPDSPLWVQVWDNPPGPQNTANAFIDPADDSFTSTAAITGEDDVAVAFTLAGEAKPKTEPEFTPPPKSKQPTLRKGDQSPDGWVEYAQKRLNEDGFKGPVDGKFDGAMEKLVRAYQKKHGLQNDGVIGNETWSSFREGPREPVGTDGRKPHSFEEKGAQARFATEKPDCTAYFKNSDTYRMTLVSVGEQPIDKNLITMLVTQPDKTTHTEKVAIGKDEAPTPDGQGNYVYITVPKFSGTFKLKKGVDPLTCMMDAYIDDALGGDRWTGPITA